MTNVEDLTMVNSTVRCFAPLLIAAQYGHLEVVKLLLDRQADVNQLNENPDVESKLRIGETPVTIATRNGYLDVLRLLLAASADLNMSMESGCSVLDMALDRADAKIVAFLRAHAVAAD